MAETETLTYTVYPTRVDGPDRERNILANDWRDPDVVFKFDGCRVGCHDDNASGHSEPDWQQGWFLWRGNQDQKEFEAVGRPPEIIVQAWKHGSVLYGALILRDESRHAL
jgi:hypothetical protein